MTRVAKYSLALTCMMPFAVAAHPVDDKALPTCKVLEAAYTAAIGSAVPAFPRDIRPAWRTLLPSKFKSPYPTTHALTAGEVRDLIANDPAYQFEKYRPACPFTATPSSKADADGHEEFISFTSPIYSSNHRLALVEISFEHKTGGFGYGSLCVVRWAEAGWTARCGPSWIT